MTHAKKRLEEKIAAEVARQIPLQIAPLREILEKLKAEAGAAQSAAAASSPKPETGSLLSGWPPPQGYPALNALAPDPAGPGLTGQMTQSGKERLQMKEEAVRARIAEIEGHIAARLAQPKPQGETHE